MLLAKGHRYKHILPLLNIKTSSPSFLSWVTTKVDLPNSIAVFDAEGSCNDFMNLMLDQQAKMNFQKFYLWKVIKYFWILIGLVSLPGLGNHIKWNLFLFVSNRKEKKLKKKKLTFLITYRQHYLLFSSLF